MFTLQNEKLKITVNKTGAELCEITSTKGKTQFMWDGNPSVWGSYAPNLFPIIGALKDNSFIFESKTYNLPKHGFVRHNKDIMLHEQTDGRLTFKLVSNEDLFKIYPFKFEFYISFKLEDNKIEVIHTVKNTDTKTMYFSVGAHPAFKCPVFNDENYDDYFLEFEHVENSKTHLINMENGLISSQTAPLLNNTNQLPLVHDLFNKDALIFKDLKSKKVALKSKRQGEILSVTYHDFPYLGIWAKPNGNYVCIEPWLGIADNESTNQQLTEKEGIISLTPNTTFEATYTIEIHNSLLV